MLRLFPYLFLLVGAASEAALVKKSIVYRDGNTEYEGYLVYNPSLKNKVPGVLITHDWLGLTDKTKAAAERFAARGFTVFAADIYGKGVRPEGPEAAGKLAGSYKKNRPLLREHMQAALKVLLEQPSVDATKVAAVGYCFGGTSVLELARTGAALSAVVTFHGGLDSPTPADGKNIKARILALHGADDPMVPPADVAAFENEMRAAKVDWQLVKYGNAVHSFTDRTAGTDNSKGAAFNELANARSWQAAQDFLNETWGLARK